MAALTDAQLTTAANTIKNETDAGENTATRIGQMFIDMVDSKPNLDASIKIAKTSISSAEILALNTTPKTLVAAPGAGKFISILNLSFIMNSGSTEYATQTELRFSSGGQIYNTTSSPLANTAFNTRFFTLGSIGVYAINNASNIDAALTVTVPTANPTAGDGTLDVYVTYTIITV